MNPNQFSVSGKECLFSYSMDSETKEFQKNDTNFFTPQNGETLVDHCSIPNTNFIVYATSNNEIVLLEEDKEVQRVTVEISKNLDLV